MDPEKIIEQNMTDLVDRIEVKNNTLWEKLIQLGLFAAFNVQDIKVSHRKLFFRISFTDLSIWKHNQTFLSSTHYTNTVDQKL